MHSPRRNPRSKQAGIEPAGWPTHSRLGNPYPRGLKPAVLDDEPPGGIDLAQAVARAGPPGGIVADYLYVEPDPRWPRLKLRLAPRGKNETDAQYEAYRRDIEQFTCTHAIYLGLCQELCTLLGNHLACPEGPCRRTGACAAVRDQDRFDIPLVLFPPCVPLDREIIEAYRQEIVAELRRVVARGGAERRPQETGGGAAQSQRPGEMVGRKAGRKGHRSVPVARPAKTA